MAARKLAVSMDEDLANQVTRAAEEDTGGNVSAWIAEAVLERLRKAQGWKLLKELEAEHGAVTEAELAEVRRQWPEG